MKFKDAALKSLKLSDPASIILLVGYLRGDIIAHKGESTNEKAYVASCLHKAPQVERMIRRNPRLSFAQFNELLLLLGKSRIGKGFFHYFLVPPEDWFKGLIDEAQESIEFAESLRRYVLQEKPLASRAIKKADFRDGVIRFRGFAMLKFGNFRFAHKTLREKTLKQIYDILQPFSLDPLLLQKKFEQRPTKALDIDPIDGRDTWLTGFLSAGGLNEDSHLLTASLSFLRPKLFEKEMSKLQKGSEDKKAIQAKIGMLSEKNISHWRSCIDNLLDQHQKNREKNDVVKKKACDITDLYLTWDYMDLYVATSMREPWEFEEIRKFVGSVLEADDLTKLGLRFFDPTQSYTDERLNKGFIESLMLKRAKVTVYLVQESDSFGKDSELAATLAQGKPVVAFVPYISDDEVGEKAEELYRRPLTYYIRRFMACKAENHVWPQPAISLFEKYLGKDPANWRGIEDSFLHDLRSFFDQPRLVTIHEDDEAFKRNLGDKFRKMSLYMAIMEKISYDKRASVLGRFHPLAMQVNLQDGVANGVLVARSYGEAIKLIHSLLSNNLSFSIEGSILETAIHARSDDDKHMTRLVETTSGCPFRAVTGQEKITNSFWNFYLKRGD